MGEWARSAVEDRKDNERGNIGGRAVTEAAVEEAAAGRVNGKWLMLIKRTREQRWVSRGDDRKVRALGKPRFKGLEEGADRGDAVSEGSEMYASGVCSPHRTVSTMLGSAFSSSLSSFVSPVCAASTNSSAICVQEM